MPVRKLLSANQFLRYLKDEARVVAILYYRDHLANCDEAIKLFDKLDKETDGVAFGQVDVESDSNVSWAGDLTGLGTMTVAFYKDTDDEV